MSDKLVERSNAIIESFEKGFLRAVPVFTSHFWEFQTCHDVDPIQLRISNPVVIQAVDSYFRDLERYKSANGFAAGELADFRKVGAFITYWLDRFKPIYDMNQSRYAHLVNRDFAIFTGLTFAELSPLKVRKLKDGVMYKQLEQLLGHDQATPDSLVTIYEGFAQLLSN
jgi:hypothetical protein